jgi:hypothetical protein
MSTSRPGRAHQAPAPADGPEQELLRVHVANGHMTSGGQGPGEVTVPRSEAKLLERFRHGRILGPAGSEGDPAASRTARGVSN